MKRVVFISILLCLLGCKKTKLENELAPLVGEWEWVESDLYIAGLINNPQSEGYTFSVEFDKKGKYYWCRSGNDRKHSRIHEKSRRTTSEGYLKVIFDCQKDEGLHVTLVSSDTIILTYHGGLPFPNDAFNYFVKK